MKKREFLAMGGAVPLMMAGCGGSGSASVRLVNASVGYPSLGFQVESTQIVSDIAYGTASDFLTVQDGSVKTNLTTETSGVVTTMTTTTRTLAKSNRYSLVAYGVLGSPKAVLINENQDTPDTGYASFNVLNTSVDVGAVDVYLSGSDVDYTTTTPIATNISGVATSAFQNITPGSYIVTVVGTGTVAEGSPDVRYQGTVLITLVNQKIYTLILSQGGGGVLTNTILLQQASDGAVTGAANTYSRLRVVVATGNTTGGVGGTTNVLNVTGGAVSSPYIEDYVTIAAGAAPAVQYTPPGGSAQTISSATIGTLVAGYDYTMLVYLTSDTVAAVALITDDNTLPVTSTNCKVRLINAVYDSSATSLPLSLAVNSTSMASNLAYAAASTYKEIAAASTTTVTVTSGFTTVLSYSGTNSLTTTVDGIYTMFVVGEGTPTTIAAGTSGVAGKFLAANV